MDLEHLVIDNIRSIRKKKGITQEKLAEHCGTSASYIGLMETYKNVPKLSTIERIANALNIPVQELFIEHDESFYTDVDEQKIFLREQIKKEIMQNMESCIDEVLKII